jgi:hypothetical protein
MARKVGIPNATADNLLQVAQRLVELANSQQGLGASPDPVLRLSDLTAAGILATDSSGVIVPGAKVTVGARRNIQFYETPEGTLVIRTGTAAGYKYTTIAANGDLLPGGADLAAPNSSFRTVFMAAASHIAGKVAGTYGFGLGDPAAVSGTGILTPLSLVYLDPADYPTYGALTAKLRVRAQLAVNDVAPTGDYTIGLYPVTRPATSGGAGLDIYTMGTVVAGSTVAFTTPAADAHLQDKSTEFAVPTAGFYILGMVTTATVAASSLLHINAQLQMRNG